MAPSASNIAIWNRALGRIGVTDLLESEADTRPDAEACRLAYDDVVHELFASRHWPWAMRQRPLSAIDEQVSEDAGNSVQTQFDVPYAFLDPSQLTVEQVDGGSATTLTVGVDYTVTPPGEGTLGYVTTTVAVPTGQSLRVTVQTVRSGWAHVFRLPADCVTPVALLYRQGSQCRELRFDHLPGYARLEYAIMADDAGTGQLLCANVHENDIDGLLYVAHIPNVAAWPRHFVDAVVWRLASEIAHPLKKDTQLAEYCLRRFEASLDEASARAQDAESLHETITPSLAVRG